MINKPLLVDFLYQWIVPCAVMLGLFFLSIRYLRTIYERMDIDRVYKFFIKAAIYIGLIVGAWLWITDLTIFNQALFYINQGITWLKSTEVVQYFMQFTTTWWFKAITFIFKWTPFYFRAFVVVWFISTGILIQSLIWRIQFVRAANIIVSTAFLFPLLTVRYIFGYQTPFFDFIQARKYVAKLKENLNDSYFDALQGYDEKGQKFDSGVGGSVQTQRIKNATLAIRQTRAFIKTAGGIRHAELVTRKSRETDTDKLIEQSLKGLGQRLVAPSIRFQDDPILNVKRGGYVFDSDVPYSAGDALGKWRSIFINPFSFENKIANGGEGFLKVTWRMLVGVIDYFRHLTPPAIYDQIKAREERLYTPDMSIQTAKFIGQQNLDLTVVPEPIDVLSGNDVATQTLLAQKRASQRIDDVTSALNAYKLSGTFDRVLVGGNTAVYQYTLPRSANLPTDFAKVQEGIANMLKINNVPIIQRNAGVLSLTMVNDVNIPVDFRKMVRNRPKGRSTLISGIAGVDALGNNILVELGDKVPHAMLFGKTGTGKTVTLMTILFSIMDIVTPDDVKIAYIDGKGNSFEFMRTDNSNSPAYHPNPFTYAQPADGSGDIDYTRALLRHIVSVVRKRIDLFKERGVSKIAEFNKRFPEEKLFELLVVFDEFSAVTDLDKQLKASELAENSTVDMVEYLAKMARSVGVRLLLANQTARKEKVPGKISANIAGRISLGVSEPIESDIALPDSKIAVHLISQAGEFYSTMNSVRNAEHGNSPFLEDETMFKLNDSLEEKFGHHDYVITREEVMKEFGAESDVEGEQIDLTYEIPNPLPTIKTPISELIGIINDYPQWATANRNSAIFENNDELFTVAPSKRKKLKQDLAQALIDASNKTVGTRKNAGEFVANAAQGIDRKAI